MNSLSNFLLNMCYDQVLKRSYSSLSKSFPALSCPSFSETPSAPVHTERERRDLKMTTLKVMSDKKRYLLVEHAIFIVTLLLLAGFGEPVSGKILHEQQQHPQMITEQVQAVLGNIAELPCDLSVVPGDKIRLVLWSNHNNTVIYSLDARDKGIEEAQHWSNEQALGGRAYFRTSPKTPSLIIENVKESDAGLYKCRLDFKRSPTVNRAVNLTVIIPPQRVVIVDDRGTELNSDLIGPYNEGTSLRLTCVSTGGWPTPKLSWWRENALLKDDSEVSMENIGAVVVTNTLTMSRLERGDLNARLTCQAVNSNISIPISTTVMLDMNFRPLSVRLLDSKSAFSADKEYTIKCEANGARPPAVMSWWRGGTRLKSHKEHSSLDGNTTTSVLHFYPAIDDRGLFLQCRAENPRIPGSAIEDDVQMDIHYVPQTTLKLGSTLNSSQIKEGDGVYFECDIKANPPIDKVSWRHYNRLLHQNATAGIIISNQSLVLQNIKRHQAGVYICEGHNKEGYGASNAVILNVKYAPVCKTNQQSVYGVARHESARITCDVDSNPESDLYFRWKFNNSAETTDIQSSTFTTDRTRSTLTYKPVSEHDYGTVLCWAGNDLIGVQKSPCVFHIIPAGKPDTVTNCSVLNQTFDSLLVACTEGFNGGLSQTFFIEVLDFQTHSVMKNFSQPKPVFDLRNLDPGASFILRVYAVNSKGRSDTQVLQASTLKSAEKQMGMSATENGMMHTSFIASMKPMLLELTPYLAVLIGAISTLVLVIIVIMTVCRTKGGGGVARNKRVAKSNGVSATEQEKCAVPLKKPVDELLDVDDKNPDVVPHSSDPESIDPDEKVFLERLNNSSRFFETIPRAVRTTALRASANSSTAVNACNNRPTVMGREEVTYAELSLPSSPAYHHHAPTMQRHHNSTTDKIIYAQIDPTKTTPSIPHLAAVHEQQTQTLGFHPHLQIGPLPHLQSSEPDSRLNTPISPQHVMLNNMGEEYVQIRTSSSNVRFTPGGNLRF